MKEAKKNDYRRLGQIYLLAICILAKGRCIAFLMFSDGKPAIEAVCIVVSAALCVPLYSGLIWFFQNTASGQRALVDQQSELATSIAFYAKRTGAHGANLPVSQIKAYATVSGKIKKLF